MVKRNIQEKISIIKLLLGQNKSLADIARENGIPKQTVRHLDQRITNREPIRIEYKERSKLPEFFKKIIIIAKDKTTSERTGANIASTINQLLENNEEKITYTKIRVNQILKKEYEKPRIIKKVFN